MTLTTKGYDQLAHLLDVEESEEDALLYRPRYNVAPTDDHWIVRLDGIRKLARAKWGIRPGGRELLINLRSETAPRRFKKAFLERRCLVPADGFYEWEGPKTARRPIWFHAPSGGLLLFAGLYELEREGLPTFTVLTTGPNSLVGKVHDRMPVVLSPEEAKAWLEKPTTDVLHPAPEQALVGTRVSPRVNAVANDDPSVLEPPRDTPRAQLELF
ncbi:MAG TPA: SOS response-associated peptidase [Planctomycetota bacterium]|nr:SOS response-associated peptidase [Planctomycetota bacterium]